MPDISIGLAIMKELASPCGTAKSACPAPPTCQFCHFLRPSKSIIKGVHKPLHKGLCVRSTCTQVCAKVCTHLYTGCKGLYAQTFAQRFVRPFRKYELFELSNNSNDGSRSCPCDEEGVQETAALACALVGRRGRRTRESEAERASRAHGQPRRSRLDEHARVAG